MGSVSFVCKASVEESCDCLYGGIKTIKTNRILAYWVVCLLVSSTGKSQEILDQFENSFVQATSLEESETAGGN